MVCKWVVQIIAKIQDLVLEDHQLTNRDVEEALDISLETWSNILSLKSYVHNGSHIREQFIENTFE